MTTQKKTMWLVCLAFLTITQQMFAQIPRPEYPRPQFERSEWVNLNGTWSYSFDMGRSGMNRDFHKSEGFDSKIIIPFCPESSLSGVKYTDFINSIWYQRKITVPAAWTGKKVLLHFGAVDYEATVYINGTKVAVHHGAGTSFAVDISPYVKAGETANLVVCANDDLRSGHQPGGKQSTNFYSAGCSYTRVTGIWQTVWMEPVDAQGLKRVYATPDIDQNQLVVRPEFYTESNTNTLTVQVLDGKKIVATRTVNATNSSVVVLPIKNPKLWTPETPNLYDVKYTVKDKSGKIIDEVSSYAGMRKIHSADGYFYLTSNVLSSIRVTILTVYGQRHRMRLLGMILKCQKLLVSMAPVCIRKYLRNAISIGLINLDISPGQNRLRGVLMRTMNWQHATLFKNGQRK